MNHFVNIYALIIVATSATTGANQVQPQVHPLVQPHTHPLVHLMEIATCILGAPSYVTSVAPIDCTVKWMINCSVKCIFFFTFWCIFMCSLKWNLRCALKCNIKCPLKFTFLLNPFVHSSALTSAQPYSSSSAIQLLPHVLSWF